MKLESWGDVTLYGDKYEVSTMGNVRNKITQRMLKHTVHHKTNHRLVSLTHKGETKKLRVHRLVAATHIPNPNKEEFVLHWDDDPTNNTVDNLRWGSRSDNNYDRVRNGSHHNTNKTHCPSGHEYTEDNVYVYSNRRSCKACAVSRSKNRYRRLTEGD